MKKSTSFFFCLIILVCFSAFVFYTGWSQFKVPQDSVGVLVSKTSGVKKTPVTASRFSWDWQWLLPTNAQLKVFSEKAVNFEKSVTGELPSGSEYARLFGEGADFSYRFNFSVSASPSAEEIVSLVKEKKVSDQADFESYLEKSADTAARKAVSLLIEKITAASGAGEVPAIVENFRALLESESPGAVYSLTLKDYSIPDISLYRQAAASYMEYAQKLQAQAAENARRASEEVSRFNQTIKKMETLGDTLKKYPELSDILKNSDSMNNTLKTIDSLE